MEFLVCIIQLLWYHRHILLVLYCNIYGLLGLYFGTLSVYPVLSAFKTRKQTVAFQSDISSTSMDRTWVFERFCTWILVCVFYLQCTCLLPDFEVVGNKGGGEMPPKSTLTAKDQVAAHQAADFDPEIAFQKFPLFYCLTQKVCKVWIQAKYAITIHLVAAELMRKSRCWTCCTKHNFHSKQEGNVLVYTVNIDTRNQASRQDANKRMHVDAETKQSSSSTPAN